MRGVLAIAIAFIAASACSSPTPPRVQMESSFWIHGDTRFSREERLIFELACDRWRTFTNSRANIWIEWDLDEETLVSLKDEPRLLKVDSLDPRVRALDIQLAGRGLVRGFVHVPDERYPMILGVVSDRVTALLPVALHEIGHTAGLDELPVGERGVMSSADPAWKFTKADWKECVRVGLCAGSMP